MRKEKVTNPGEKNIVRLSVAPQSSIWKKVGRFCPLYMVASWDLEAFLIASFSIMFSPLSSFDAIF